MSEPLISVLMPTYNHERFIGEAIESVLAQTTEPVELLVGDDASSDGTAAVVGGLDDRHPGRIRYFRSSTNVGMARNLNRLLAQSTGEFVAITSGDDVWLPRKLGLQIAQMRSNTDLALSCSRVEVFYDDGSGREAFIFPPLGEFDASKGSVIERTFDLGFTASTALIRREAIPEHGFDDRIVLVADWLFWIEVLQAGELGFVDEVCSRYRLHSTNTSRVMNEEVWTDYLVTLLIVAARYPHLREEARAMRKRLLAKMLVDGFLAENDIEFNLEIARAAMRVSPFAPLGVTLGREFFRRVGTRGR